MLVRSAAQLIHEEHATIDLPAGAYRVSMNQPLARLAFYLLEPRSNDGLVTWNLLDEAIKRSQYPILRTRN